VNAAPPNDPSLAKLFSELAQETGTLVRQEVQLAKVELTEKAREAGKDAVLVGSGLVAVNIAVLALVAALILALGTLIPMWVSALLVGVALGVVGVVLMQRGVARLKQIDPVPRATVQTLKEDKTWASRQVSQ
jgi:uncharacterized membrane protein YqjE